MHSKSYTSVPLDRLDEIRLILRGKLKELERTTGDRYKIRTFFLGPRPKYNNPYSLARPASTRKSVATGAKIGIYKITGEGRYTWPKLDRYI